MRFPVACRQLYAVLKKNVLIKIRQPQQVLIEIAAPLVLLFLLLYGFSMSDTVHHDSKQYTGVKLPIAQVTDAILSSVKIQTPIGPIAITSPFVGNITPPITLSQLIELSQLVDIPASNFTFGERELVALVNATCSVFDCSVPTFNGTDSSQQNCIGGVCLTLNPGSVDVLGELFGLLEGPLPVPPFDMFVALSQLVQELLAGQV